MVFVVDRNVLHRRLHTIEERHVSIRIWLLGIEILIGVASRFYKARACEPRISKKGFAGLVDERIALIGPERATKGLLFGCDQIVSHLPANEVATITGEHLKIGWAAGQLAKIEGRVAIACGNQGNRSGWEPIEDDGLFVKRVVVQACDAICPGDIRQGDAVVLRINLSCLTNQGPSATGVELVFDYAKPTCSGKAGWVHVDHPHTGRWPILSGQAKNLPSPWFSIKNNSHAIDVDPTHARSRFLGHRIGDRPQPACFIVGHPTALARRGDLE